MQSLGLGNWALESWYLEILDGAWKAGVRENCGFGAWKAGAWEMLGLESWGLGWVGNVGFRNIWLGQFSFGKY